MPLTEAQKRAKAKYSQKKDVKERYAAKKKENFKTIAACYRRPEAEYIAAVFAAHKVTPAEVIRGAAAALLDGQPIRTEAEPLPIPDAEAEQTEPAEPAEPAEENAPKD